MYRLLFGNSRRLVFFCIMCASILVLPATVAGFDVPEVIRVGLESKYKDLDSITVYNQSVLISTREGGYREFGVVSGTGSFNAVVSGGYFVDISAAYASFAEAVERAKQFRDFGFNAAVAFSPAGFTVYTGPYDSQANADADAATLSGTVKPPAARVILSDGGTAAAVLESGVQIADGNRNAVGLGERSYRGAIEFSISGSRLTAVNVLTLDEYLYSAVPSEMPSTWPIEAIKAQAVAGRSYALTRMTAHQDAGYHFCDRVHCQNYMGAGNEAESAVTAVNETSGVLAYYNGEPINAVYFSSSGGYTESSENTWTETVPYLRAITDAFEVSGKVWERTYTLAQIQSLLNENIGTVTRVYISRTSETGRVQELVIQGTTGSKTLTKEGIRTFFSASAEGMLESRNFSMQGADITNVVTQLTVAGFETVAAAAMTELFAMSSTGETAMLPSETTVVGRDGQAVYRSGTSVLSGGSSQGNTAVFTGRGWGHGVGMSQFGAKDMAEAGFDYIQILKHYYTGIDVR